MNGLKSVLKHVNKHSCPYKINLHCHTSFSDGSLSPLELVKQASITGVNHLSITDHHTIDGYKSIINSSELNNINLESLQLYSGTEISGLLKGCLVHILALDFNIYNSDIEKYLQGHALMGEEIKAELIVSAIHKANGLAILAHPARYRIQYNDLIIEANKLGFDGIEVWYNYERSIKWTPSPFICDKISSLTNELGMLSTCGTDTHGYSILSR
tara:strand:- start:2259 stop:2900 length:642 start_codon:yes stop_codon:yes gene_type:complete